ncbi:DUF2800 domain-containing protein [Candidatus Saccharibacteria bacterium]|nr:DUF2800 domain-containing protein [Candidatus Saccharibacteria bacterium]
MGQINHGDREHALLSASGAKRWLACTPSARLEEFFPELTSKYAEEGTKAHETAEKILRALIEGRRRPAFKNEEVKEIAASVQPYVDLVWDTYNDLQKQNGDAVLFLESRVDFSEYVPEGFGTGDAVVISGDTLHIIDLKYGKGVPVSARDNEQLRLYAIGSLTLYGDIYDIENVVMHISQPRLDSHSFEELSIYELEEWAETIVRPKAAIAFEGTGAFIDGEHCQFCKAAATCRHRLEKYTEITKLQNMKPEELANNGELSKVLREASNIEKWLKQVKSYAIGEMKEGVKFPDVKLVEGKVSYNLKSEDDLVRLLKAEGVDEILLYKSKELQPKTELQKLVGAKRFKEITEDLYERSVGEPTIALAESKKEEWKPGGDFAEVKVADYEGA